MDIDNFTTSKAGSFVPTIEDQLAFVPNALPPNIDISEMNESAMAACLAIGELKGACRRLQNPYILIRPLLQREALTSSAMEGTYTTSDQLLLMEAGIDSKNGDDATKEVQNYVKALRQSVHDLGEIPISHRMIRQAHQILLSNVGRGRGANKHPGEYKKDQNWIGGLTIQKARFVPPPPKQAQECMDALEAYINREGRSEVTAIIDLAFVHYQFESIHPFADGNGRVGRMLTALMTIESGLLELPVLYISAAIEKYKDEYIDLMYNVSAKGEWAEWVRFFLARVCESCAETIKTIDLLVELQEVYRRTAQKLMRSANILTVVDYIFEVPILTVPMIEKRLGVTYRAARNIIDKLIEGEILHELDNYHPKVFVAPEIIRLVQFDE